MKELDVDNVANDTPATVNQSEHSKVTELHRDFANGTIGEQDYDRALSDLFKERDRFIATAA
jgi:hypothetical protein